jgi:hypothetical protein
MPSEPTKKEMNDVREFYEAEFEDFDSMNTWTLGMVNLAFRFAIAYRKARRPDEDSSHE